ncbi:MAG: UDP-3-O-(3-hydroxymyristoyl)glucosamine N-acyltransferase [Armatimonadota bacterium]
MRMALGEIAEMVHGELEGDGDLVITGAGTLEGAGDGDIAFVDAPSRLAEAERTGASAVIIPREAPHPPWPNNTKPVIRVAQPRRAFAQVLSLLAPEPVIEPGVHPSAWIGDGVQFGDGVSVGPLAFVGHRAVLSDGVVVGPQAHVGHEVRVGARTFLHPRAVILDRVTIGEDCIIHSGAVIGADGFGYTQTAQGRHEKVPQIGTVVLGDRVEVGANATIDRATVDATRIGNGCKIDNLSHVAHNCVLGDNVIIAGQTGLCGGAVLEDNVMLGGQVGVQGYATIGRGAVIGAQGGVISDVPPGVFYSGYPAGPHRQQMRIYALSRRLPEMEKRLRAVERALERKASDTSEE